MRTTFKNLWQQFVSCGVNHKIPILLQCYNNYNMTRQDDFK